MPFLLSLDNDEENIQVWRQYKEAPKAKVFFNSLKEYIYSVATNCNQNCVLIFYRKPMAVTGVYEAGIYYGAGPECENRETFPTEILRFFSYDEECVATAWQHYLLIMEKEVLLRVYF